VLLDRRTVERGYFSKAAMERLLQSNSEGRDHSKEVFSLLSLELWQRIFLERQSIAV